MKIFLYLLLIFCGIFAFANNATLLQDSLLLPPLEESQKMFPFETGKSPLEGINGVQYFGVILVLLGLLVFLWFVKNRLNTPRLKDGANPLRFFNKETLEKSEDSVEVQSVTTLNVQSKLIVFEAYNKRYLVILNSNDTTLIDSYEIKSAFKDMLEQDNPNNAK
ncbi:hypothetical protein LS70_003070 [Helicobacter sp. MIT 11-5569]|uniref:hypothetical protein n=1 Tax=Helicobacter sp. MIT 11-5569 TaxID=1548151 RepID=UPI00051FA237|nr:hypothetical protein [Helicobacter sp. MIT 11-5569]TLD84543.1 hypothetical protein LS70_003070 [Helicobacter sp. MIT 11-5569]